MNKKQRHNQMDEDYSDFGGFEDQEFSAKSHKRDKSKSLSDKRRKSRGVKADPYAY